MFVAFSEYIINSTTNFELLAIFNALLEARRREVS